MRSPHLSLLPPPRRVRAEQVKKPVNPLSLRVSGHLLLGLSRIFAKKVAYLASDANEVITKIKTVRRTSERWSTARPLQCVVGLG